MRETVFIVDEQGSEIERTFDFRYDNAGLPYALHYTDTFEGIEQTYYYVTNLQGDVMYMVDEGGDEVASYEYDPYGKLLYARGDMAEVNPIRYRGYYYDTDTDFYYLQSRYYDPAICRFVNYDGYASTGQGLMGYNMFAYCNNNPINKLDLAGREAVHVAILYDANTNYGWDKINFSWIDAYYIAGAYEELDYHVDMYPHKNTEEFIESWNTMGYECCDGDGYYDIVYVIVHGGAGKLGYSYPVGGDRYSFDALDSTVVKMNIELYSCNGGTRGADGNSAAQRLANLAGCPVRAVVDGLCFVFPFGGKAYPVKGGHWQTFKPQKRLPIYQYNKEMVK